MSFGFHLLGTMLTRHSQNFNVLEQWNLHPDLFLASTLVTRSGD